MEVGKKHPTWSQEQIERQSEMIFENAAVNFFNRTLLRAKKLRPKALWGYYGFPHCFNRFRDYSSLERCPEQVEQENDKLSFLFASAAFPSLYTTRNQTGKVLTKFVQGKMREANRVATMNVQKLPFMRYQYTDSMSFMSSVKYLLTNHFPLCGITEFNLNITFCCFRRMTWGISSRRSELRMQTAWLFGEAHRSLRRQVNVEHLSCFTKLILWLSFEIHCEFETCHFEFIFLYIRHDEELNALDILSLQSFLMWFSLESLARVVSLSFLFRLHFHEDIAALVTQQATSFTFLFSNACSFSFYFMMKFSSRG